MSFSFFTDTTYCEEFSICCSRYSIPGEGSTPELITLDGFVKSRRKIITQKIPGRTKKCLTLKDTSEE